MKHLADLNVLVLGLGDSGLAMAAWCALHGAQVTVWDSRSAPPQAAALAEQAPAARLITGDLPSDALNGVQLVLKSPGLAPSDARIAPLLAQAAATGIAVEGELSLFARALADLKAERGYAPHVLAITGTNGKTTTTSLTALLVARAGRRVGLAGNIGPTLLGTLQAALAQEPVPSVDAEPAPAEAEALPADEPLATHEVQPIIEAAHDASSEPAAALTVQDTAQATAPLPPEQPQPAEAEVADDPITRVAGDAESAEPLTADDTDAADSSPDAATEPSAEAEAEVSILRTLDDAAKLPILPPPPPPPVFEFLPEVWVLELSSFQLDGVSNFDPSSATVLNITQDHLDWHGSEAAYAAAKARIFGHGPEASATLVINRDDPAVEALVPPPITVKGARGRPSRLVHRKVVRFGLDAPRAPGDFGLITQNGMAWLVRTHEADETLQRSGRKGTAIEPEDLSIQRLMPADALRIRGRHNASNALAALALATSIGCPLAPMLHGLREYTGEPHRVEFITSIAGVEVFDDSKGTNVGATVAAINGLGTDRDPAKLVLILGGDGKGQDFSPLAAPVSRYARAVALIGRDAPALAQALAGSGVIASRHDTLEDATRWCFEQAQSGDAVLLSPACASLDMFRNYAHRAEVFVATVQALAADRGEALA